MTKPQHPADAADEAGQIEAIRTASQFCASLFVGRGQFLKAYATTVFGAMRAGEKLRRDHGSIGPDYLLYAIKPDGSAVFIARATVEKLVHRYEQKHGKVRTLQ